MKDFLFLLIALLAAYQIKDVTLVPDFGNFAVITCADK